MIFSLKYCKLIKKQNKDTKDRISHLRIKMYGCGYKEKDRKLKEQFINGIKKNEITSEQELC